MWHVQTRLWNSGSSFFLHILSQALSEKNFWCWLKGSNTFIWSQGSLHENFQRWIPDKLSSEHKALPCFAIWALWLSRNKMLFQDFSLSIEQVAHSIRLSYREIWKAPQKILWPLKHPESNSSFAWGFFDRACQGTPGKCGAGMILHVSSLHYFSLKHGAGTRTDNRAGTCALWLLLKTDADKGIKELQVLGNSKLLMVWANGKCQLSNLNLGPILLRVLEVKQHFDFISFTHIYREFNTKADSLSKDALSLQEGSLLLQEFKGHDLLAVSHSSPFWQIVNLP